MIAQSPPQVTVTIVDQHLPRNHLQRQDHHQQRYQYLPHWLLLQNIMYGRNSIRTSSPHTHITPIQMSLHHQSVRLRRSAAFFPPLLLLLLPLEHQQSVVKKESDRVLWGQYQWSVRGRSQECPVLGRVGLQVQAVAAIEEAAVGPTYGLLLDLYLVLATSAQRHSALPLQSHQNFIQLTIKLVAKLEVGRMHLLGCHQHVLPAPCLYLVAQVGLANLTPQRLVYIVYAVGCLCSSTFAFYPPLQALEVDVGHTSSALTYVQQGIAPVLTRLKTETALTLHTHPHALPTHRTPLLVHIPRLYHAASPNSTRQPSTKPTLFQPLVPYNGGLDHRVGSDHISSKDLVLFNICKTSSDLFDIYFSLAYSNPVSFFQLLLLSGLDQLPKTKG